MVESGAMCLPPGRSMGTGAVVARFIAALTSRAAEISGIPLVNDADQEEVEKVLCPA